MTHASADADAGARPPAAAVSTEALGVFAPNKAAPVHRWVSFTEGFSARLVFEELHDAPAGTYVFDPFGGTGTTPVLAAQLGLRAGFAEVNPYLREAAETKIAALAADRAERGHATAELLGGLLRGPADDDAAAAAANPLARANATRDFVAPAVLDELVGWLLRFEAMEAPLARRLGRLAVATAAIGVSNMKRAVDLRRRTATELARRRPEVREVVRKHVSDMVADAHAIPVATGTGRLVSTDARTLPDDVPEIDIVVTSPPYLNGTNYFRNTKLELLLLGLIEDEAALGAHRTRAITAGINNVSRRIAEPARFAHVEPVAERLDAAAYDPRIPTMVRAYFSDMAIVLERLRARMRPGGRLVLDIGDSRFAGVHVDTPELLAAVAESHGWVRGDTRVLRTRTAKDGSPLCQKLLSLCSS
jgi:hypothetical protein